MKESEFKYGKTDVVTNISMDRHTYNGEFSKFITAYFKDRGITPIHKDDRAEMLNALSLLMLEDLLKGKRIKTLVGRMYVKCYSSYKAVIDHVKSKMERSTVYMEDDNTDKLFYLRLDKGRFGHINSWRLKSRNTYKKKFNEQVRINFQQFIK